MLLKFPFNCASLDEGEARAKFDVSNNITSASSMQKEWKIYTQGKGNIKYFFFWGGRFYVKNVVFVLKSGMGMELQATQYHFKPPAVLCQHSQCLHKSITTKTTNGPPVGSLANNLVLSRRRRGRRQWVWRRASWRCGRHTDRRSARWRLSTGTNWCSRRSSATSAVGTMQRTRLQRHVAVASTTSIQQLLLLLLLLAVN